MKLKTTRKLNNSLKYKITTCALNLPINNTSDNQTISFMKDEYIKGGFRVVDSMIERDNIDCCYRKPGMQVVVVGINSDFKTFRLVSEDCDSNEWEEVDSNLLVPTKTSDLTNDGEDGVNRFITVEDIPEVINIEKTSELINDGEDGTTPFITAQDIPVPTPQVKSDWNATTGIQEILNKPTIPSPVDITGKVDKTTTSIVAPNIDFKYAYIFDESNNNRRMLAGDLGKNIANSSLTSVVGAGMTLGAPYVWNAASHPFSITGLIDKSADTTYNKLIVENDSGQVGLSDGKTLLKSIPSLLNETEKTVWKSEMNGGWTTDTMSVGLINPIVLKKFNAPQYINLIGANLNLNPASLSVKIVNDIGDTEIATIPNSQVQLNNTIGNSLLFWFNFKDLELADYKIKLWNGVSEYITPNTFKIVSDVQSIDMAGITWTLNNYLDKINSNVVISNTTVNLGQILLNSDDTIFDSYNSVGDGGLVTSATSSFINVGGVDLTMEDNFLLEFSLLSDNGATMIEGGLSFDKVPVFGDTISKGIKIIYPSVISYDGGGYLLSVLNNPVNCIIMKTNNNIVVTFSNSQGTSTISNTITPNNNKIRLKVGKRTSGYNTWTGIGKFQLLNGYKF